MSLQDRTGVSLLDSFNNVKYSLCGVDKFVIYELTIWVAWSETPYTTSLFVTKKSLYEEYLRLKKLIWDEDPMVCGWSNYVFSVNKRIVTV